ncbi:MAG: hypothetical protein BWY27_01110 [Bacteroidetes bacterium ADurb.Bin234]|nr:MAG: hypothetical protein BWY27_01110 [Bacteroidetes bacterium ADurb.Bin234]
MTNTKKNQKSAAPRFVSGQPHASNGKKQNPVQTLKPGHFIMDEFGNPIRIRNAAHAINLADKHFALQSKGNYNHFDYINANTPDERRQVVIFNLLLALCRKLEKTPEEIYLNQLQKNLFMSTFPQLDYKLTPMEVLLFKNKWEKFNTVTETVL